MPQISLIPTRAVLHMSRGETLGSQGDRSRFVFKVKPDRPLTNEIRLSTGEKFNELDGTVTFQLGSPPADWPTLKARHTPLGGEKEMAIIGTLTYSEKYEGDLGSEPASYSVEVFIDPSQFDQLVRSARQGKLPAYISIDVVGEGIKYGWEPDGSGKEWDNKARPQLPVVWVGFGVILAADASDVEEEPQPGQPSLEDLPPTRAQVAQLMAKVSQLPMKLFWIGAALVLALILFRR